MSGSSKSGSGLPLRSALKTDDDADRTPPASGSLKAVQIAEPVPEYRTFDDDVQTTKQFRATHGRRLSGKLAPSPQFSTSGRSSTNDDTPSLRPTDDGVATSSQHQRQQYYSEKMVAQIGDWLERQQLKQARRKKTKKHQANGAPKSPIKGHDLSAPDLTPDALKSHDDQGADPSMPDRKRAGSVGSQESDISLDRLQRIVDDSMAALGLKPSHRFSPRSTRPRPRRRSLVRASSDTDYVDGDVIVPDCDVRLDNSKTVSFCYSDTGENPPTDENSSKAQVEAWRSFKNEIIRTAHTLRLKGWRRIELGSGDSIEVERISGALTNAVYAVTPPSDLPKIPGKKQPPKLLLRIYGPQVEHLIDRENELMVLQRLARKKIGPRLLGTFMNGRFEQFFNASPLTPVELRDPDTSKQIAKRMRELHDGIELLSSERDDGPSVWKSWDSWRDKATRIMRYVDKRVEAQAGPNQRRPSSVINAWKDRGYVCGVPWPQFVETVLKYRAFIQGFYKGEKVINDNLVFAHNDTQYGNILRFQPDDAKSPLLQPANKHKQLVVIDFEYAGANLPGYDFANQFIEWTYNYHDPAPHLCHAHRYPRPEEQRRFLKSYVDHRPEFPHAGSTPRLTPLDSPGNSGPGNSITTTPKLLPTSSSSSIVDFMLDSRAPPGGWSAAEKAREEQIDKEIRQLMEETRIWRAASSAFWITWGIVQAKLPGIKEDGEVVKEEPEDEDESDEFDYLGYSQDRALFFWGDMVQLGIVKFEELPESLRSRIKIVDY